MTIGYFGTARRRCILRKSEVALLFFSLILPSGYRNYKNTAEFEYAIPTQSTQFLTQKYVDVMKRSGADNYENANKAYPE